MSPSLQENSFTLVPLGKGACAALGVSDTVRGPVAAATDGCNDEVIPDERKGFYGIWQVGRHFTHAEVAEESDGGKAGRRPAGARTSLRFAQACLLRTKGHHVASAVGSA
ncbi:hypothetical protein B296_00011823 [Ensete ventricosum]|uniref:Uncharacterized protein n=1 Tax=Ensete ventricosum TaxID=4639 RepID=A0A426Z514_ENSVE|nr:hypothetical protein B296_00011823 [Ensete ventricosum]